MKCPYHVMPADRDVIVAAGQNDVEPVDVSYPAHSTTRSARMNPRPMILLSIVAGLTLACSASIWAVHQSTSRTGEPRIIDGDTLEIAGDRFRLLGIDAPEMGQSCVPIRGAGLPFDCGWKARYELQTYLMRREVTCTSTSRDTYGRRLAFCSTVDDGTELNRWMVTSGWAVAYGDSSYRYVSDERHARAFGYGIWGTFFDQPSFWRTANDRRK